MAPLFLARISPVVLIFSYFYVLRTGTYYFVQKKTNLITLLVLGIHLAFGQDVSFSQFYANPMYLNPAFAGSEGAPRVALQYRNQWHQFDNAFTTYSVAADLPVESLEGGLGLQVMNDAQAGNLLNQLQLNLAYAVFIQLSREYRIHAGLQGGYHQNSLKTNELIFADNLDINYGNHGSTAEIITEPNYSYADFSMGLLVYSKRLFFGGAIHHLTEPSQSYAPDNAANNQLDRKYTLHAGARLPVFRHGHLRKKFDVSPQLILQQQGISNQINYGMFATKRGLTAGAWLRQNFGIRYDAIIFLVGFVNNRMQFTYSYDWTISGLWGQSGGTSEVSLAFLLKSKRKKGYFPFSNSYEEEFGAP